MKNSNRNQYRIFRWDFAEYLMYRGQLRGNHKKSQKRIFSKGARRNNKKVLNSEIELI